ncbi:MAG: sugar ABC transporter substrate-binding protein [Limnochordales bacterium]|nr:sugar ABC transporter substrate-binding protein [Limnochordales bacterium]
MVIFTGAAEPTQLPEQEKIRQEFEKKHPDVKVEYVPVVWPWVPKFNTMLAAGAPPDAVVPGLTLDYLDQGVWLDLDPYIARDRVDTSKYFEAVWKETSWKGIRYGMPVGIYTDAVFYNKDLLEQAGLPDPPHSYDDPSWTWDKYISYAKKITKDINGDGTPEIWGIDGVGNTLVFLRSFGAEQFTPDLKTALFDTPQMRAGFEYLQSVFRSRVTPTYQERVAQGLGGVGFPTGKVGMLIDFTSRYRNLLNVPNLNWDLAAKPRGPAGPKVLLYSDTINIVASSPNKELAWEWVKFISQPDVLTRLAIYGLRAIPPTAEGAVQWAKEMAAIKRDVDWMVFIKGLPYAAAPEPWHPAYQEISTLRKSVEDDIKAMKVDVTTALKSLNEKVQQLLDDYWAKQRK